MSARIQNHIMYGTKLIANSAIKFSREKYKKEIAIIDIRNSINIQSLYYIKYNYYLNFLLFIAIKIK
jgi:hypothetical protein